MRRPHLTRIRLGVPRFTKPRVKPLAERNRIAVGVVGIAVLAVLVVGAFSYDELPFIKGTTDVSAYFAEAGGLKPGSEVRVSGMEVGKVSTVALDGDRVLVEFTVRDGIPLGDRTEAAIKTETVLGTKMLEVVPRGDGELRGTIPLERTTSPYDLPSALGDLTVAVSGLDTHQLAASLTTLADTFRETPPDLKAALEGVAQFSATLDARDDRLRSLLANAKTVTGVLAKRSDQIATLVADANALLSELLTQRDALDALMGNVAAVSRQISAVVADNRTQLKPAVDKLNGVLGILDGHKKELQRTLFLLRRYAMSFGEVLGSGPFFKASLVNLVPGQFAQPYIDAAFSDLGLDPNTQLPSQLVDPATGQAGTPPLPMPFPRTGQGGEPKRFLPDAITGNQDPNLPVQSPGRYPYRPPEPAPAPGGPPPGPPAPPPPGIAGPASPAPSPSPVFLPAPNEAVTPGGQTP